MNKISPSLSIPAFYAGRSVFITGATGFMGKILMEKLLYSCPEVREIFILLRPKKGINIDNRLRNLLALPVFDRLKKEKPEALEKIIPVSGNTSEEGLGLPDVERRVIIERVSVIFHVAASVRFDDNLRDAVIQNTRSTRDICILAAQIKKLAVLVHVSTTYSQADKPIVEEKLYPCNVDWKKTIKIAETFDSETLRTLTPKYLGNFPNTYTFTKRLAEQVMNDYSHVVPAVVFRPSIVVSSMLEPMPGWLDNFNGPVGIMVGGGKGVLRVLYADPSQTADFIPVDVAIKAMIIASWKRGLQTITKDPSVHVYNCASSDVKSISVGELKNLGLRCAETLPLEGMIWAPSVTYVNSKFLYYMSVLLLHLMPSLIIDQILKFSGRKPILANLQRKVYVANNALSHFLVNEWKFKNENLLQLLYDVPPSDIDSFGFEFASFDIHAYFKNCLIGAKKYLLNEALDNIPNATAHYHRMVWIDRIFKGLLLIVAVVLSFKIGLVSYMISTIEELTDIYSTERISNVLGKCGLGKTSLLTKTYLRARERSRSVLNSIKTGYYNQLIWEINCKEVLTQSMYFAISSLTCNMLNRRRCYNNY